ncbi:PFK5 [Symbiodinium sp. CCMP2456]|nr:PFK5 [Symbiodinium sp. CCMP2456]
MVSGPKVRPPRSGRDGVTDPAKGTPEDAQEDRREKQDAFFDSLPQDHLTNPELDLRDLLVEALKGKGLAKLSPIASDREFCRRKALLEWPRGIRLTAWIENRIGAEVEVVHGAFGSEVGVRLLDVGGMEEVDPEAFLASLPPDDFTQEENTLREKLFEAWRDLTSRSDQRDVSLLDLGEHPNVKKAGVFLPPKMLRSWIEARLGAEMVLTENEAGELLADFVNEVASDAAHSEAPLAPADARAEDEAKILSFFRGPLRPEEKDLERACIDAIIKSTLSASTSFTSSGGSTPMNFSSVLNADKAFQEAWRRCKSKWSALEPPEGPLEVPLSRWVEMRVTDVKVSRDPFVSLRSTAVARLGLQRQLQKRPNSPGREAPRALKRLRASVPVPLPSQPPGSRLAARPALPSAPFRSLVRHLGMSEEEEAQASRPKELANGCVRGNACREIFHNPSEVRAAIVTCGGLCPGLNSIIREITNCLWPLGTNMATCTESLTTCCRSAGSAGSALVPEVKTILGMQAGYNGCSSPDDFPPIQSSHSVAGPRAQGAAFLPSRLNVDNVRDIHMKGGSILKARGLVVQSCTVYSHVDGGAGEEERKQAQLRLRLRCSTGPRERMGNSRSGAGLVLEGQRKGHGHETKVKGAECWAEAGRGGMDDPDKILDQRKPQHVPGEAISSASCFRLQKMGINMLQPEPMQTREQLPAADVLEAAANLLYKAARKRDMPLSIVGVPKSIDNDIVFFDKTFGFDSAVAAASEVIREGPKGKERLGGGDELGAETPERCRPWPPSVAVRVRCIGVRLTRRRDAGFVAMHAALASTIVDLVMIPEARGSQETERMEEIMKHVDTTLARKDFMVVAVAEGAGQKFVSTGKKDSTGHTVYGDIGTYLKDQINAHLKKSGGRSFYIDPSYIIRSVTIRPNDHIYCSRLARDAVHTAMRGYTGVCVGPIHNIIVVMPSNLIASRKKKISVHSSSWQSCVQSRPQAAAGATPPLPPK